MLKLFFKIGLLLIIVLTINVVIGNQLRSLLPLPWGNIEVDDKLSYFKQMDNCSVLIMGSSHIDNHVVPTQFDSLLNQDGIQVQSFNVTDGGFFPPETFYIYENLLKKDLSKVKYAILELRHIKSIDYDNWHINETSYWYTPENYAFTMRSILEANNPVPIKGFVALSHSVCYADKLLNLGLMNDIATYKAKVAKTHIDFATLDTTRGFVARPVRKWKPGADTSEYTSKARISREAFSKSYANGSYNAAYLKKINELIALSKQKGIHLVFLLTNAYSDRQYAELLPLYNRIDEQHRIEISDAREYPQIYFARNHVDPEHLNVNGAAMFTQILANKFKPIYQSVDTQKSAAYKNENR